MTQENDSSSSVSDPLPPKDRWYYADGQEQLGPITTSQASELVKTGQLRSDTLVWKRGMNEWTPLRSSPLGKLVSTDLPPSIPKNPHSPPPLQTKTENEANKLAVNQPKVAVWTNGSFWGGVCLGLIVSYSWAFIISHQIRNNGRKDDKAYMRYQEWRGYKILDEHGIPVPADKLTPPENF